MTHVIEESALPATRHDPDVLTQRFATKAHRPLRIALTVDPYLPVPPNLYGGIERIVDFLVRGLVNRGHDVTLYAHPESKTAGRHVPYGAPPHTGPWLRCKELWQLGSKLWLRRKQVDVIHSFGRLAGLLPALPNRRLAKIQSYQREVPWSGVEKAVRLAGPSITFTACSSSMYRQYSERRGEWRTIFNGVDLENYNFVSKVDPDAPLAFLGRLEPIKGAHNAIAIARAARRRLIIAGNRVASSEDYFNREIAPLVDGDRVNYVGPVDDKAKNMLLGSCAGLLMPIEWEEPFGIVMAEALACGTPVVGFERGSVPEVIGHGITGFVCRDNAEATAAVGRLGSLDRAAARRFCQERFSSDVIVRSYQDLYYELIASLPTRTHNSAAA
jgi:glycosyltransferase involved in cell wall biosynthesis